MILMKMALMVETDEILWFTCLIITGKWMNKIVIKINEWMY